MKRVMRMKIMNWLVVVVLFVSSLQVNDVLVQMDYGEMKV